MQFTDHKEKRVVRKEETKSPEASSGYSKSTQPGTYMISEKT